MKRKKRVRAKKRAPKPSGLTAPQAAKVVGVTLRYFHKLRRSDPAAPKPGAGGRYVLADVEAFRDRRGGQGSKFDELRKERLELELERSKWTFRKERGDFISREEIEASLAPLVTDLQAALVTQFCDVLPPKARGLSPPEIAVLHRSTLAEIFRRLRAGLSPMIPQAPLPK